MHDFDVSNSMVAHWKHDEHEKIAPRHGKQWFPANSFQVPKQHRLTLFLRSPF